MSIEEDVSQEIGNNKNNEEDLKNTILFEQAQGNCHQNSHIEDHKRQEGKSKRYIMFNNKDNQKLTKQVKATSQTSISKVFYEQFTKSIQICFICSNEFLLGVLFKGESCPDSHFFCLKCGEDYYESQIKNKEVMFEGKEKSIAYVLINKNNSNERVIKDKINEDNMKIEEFDEEDKKDILQIYSNHNQIIKKKSSIENHFYCPIFSCVNIIKNEIILKLLSPSCILLYKEQAEEYKTGKYKQTKSNMNKRLKTIKNDCQIYGTKHIVTSKLTIIERYSKNKSIICSSCQYPSLFNRNNSFFLKCMNCFSKECKFCHKIVTKSHFDITEINTYCRVYYRMRLSDSKNKQSFFISVVLMMIIVIYFIIGVIKTPIYYLKLMFFYPERDFLLFRKSHSQEKNQNKKDVIVLINKRRFTYEVIMKYKPYSYLIHLLKMFIFLILSAILLLMSCIFALILWIYVPGFLIIG